MPEKESGLSDVGGGFGSKRRTRTPGAVVVADTKPVPAHPSPRDALSEPDSRPALVLVESNTTGTGRRFCWAAADLGFTPILLTAGRRHYSYIAEDGVATRIVDTSSPTAVLAVCRELAADRGVAAVTSSSEYYIAVAAAVAADLGLPGPDSAAVDRCRDKSRQRDRLAAAGVPVPRFHPADDPTEATRAADKLGYPVVVKPVSGSGSIGVRLCESPTEVITAAETVDGPLLVEELVTGPEFSVETFHREVLCVNAKHLGAPPYFVETGHDVPAGLPRTDRSRLESTAVAALDALGLGWGPAHTELRMSPHGPVVIEVNPRLAGGMIPVMLDAAIGVDPVAASVAAAAGRSAAVRRPAPGYGAIRFLVASEHVTVSDVADLSEIRRLPGVVAAEVTVSPGTRIELTHSFTDRYGYVLATGADPDQSSARADRALAALNEAVTLT